METETKELVVIESPWKAESITEQIRNKAYALRCLKDSILRGEAPYASHLIYTQVLNEADEDERNLGMLIGFAWGSLATKTVVYQDYGITDGMNLGISRAIKEGRSVEVRSIGFKIEVVTLHDLLIVISSYFNISLRDLKSVSRKAAIANARLIYYKVAQQMFPKTSDFKIGIVVNRNHSTVYQGVRKVDLKHYLTAYYNQFCEHNGLIFEELCQ